MTKVNIEISGDVGCGKSIVMFEIAKMMFSKFAVDVKSPQLDKESVASNLAFPEDWQLESIRDTEWTMTESVNHSALENKMNIDKLETQSEEQPKRVKVEYVKHNVNDEGGKYWEVARDWAEGNVEFRFKRNDGFYCLIGSNEELLRFYTNRTLYILQETEITERDEFIETAVNMLCEGSHDNEASHYAEWFGYLFDSGKFKLVGDEQ